MAAKRPRLYLIDGYSNIYRAFHAIRELSNSKGEPTNAVYGFINMLRKLLREEKPELIGVALDVSGDSLRKEQYSEYKATRKPMPDDLRTQLPWVRQAIEGYRIPILELARYEADDVLGTLAKKASAEGYDVFLVSADKDLMQLVDDHVFLAHTGRDKVYDAALVEEDFGVPPGQVADVLAIQGDVSDNVPGVQGIGAKGAVELIRDFGSLEDLLARTEEIEQKSYRLRKRYRANLEEHRADAELSKELVTIHTDLDIDFDPEKLLREPLDQDALAELFQRLEFTSLLEELDAGDSSSGESVAAAVELESVQGWEKAVASLGDEIYLGVVYEPQPVGVVVGAAEGDAWFADFRREGLREAVVATLRAWLADSARRLVGHDLKEVLRLADGAPDARVAAALDDSMLFSYVLRPALRGHGLSEVALDRLQYSVVTAKEAGWEKGVEPALGTEGLRVFAAERVELPRRFVGVMREELSAGGLESVYREIEEPLVPVLMRMEERGIALDSGLLADMSSDLEGRLVKLEEAIYKIAGERFNINSPSQLGEIMFERLDYPVVKRTRKTKSYSTDADTLHQLALKGFPLAEKLLDYREISKLKSTYVDALPTMVAADGRLHTRYEQAVAATGRLSSVSPNLQNIPVRTDLGRSIRRAFVAPEGRLLLVADYSQIELRVLAHIAEEPALIAAFEAGEDIHRATAAVVMDVAPELVTARQRRAAKVINFGIIYGMSAFGLSQNLGISRGDAQQFIDAYLERYAGVKHYMDATLEAAETEGKVETLYGRVRWLPELQAKNHAVRENAKRMAINARIQGTAADLLKKAMIAVDARLRAEMPESHLLLTVHDELVLEVPEEGAEQTRDLVRQEMESVASLRVPLVVDAAIGPTWFDAKA
jgi:DNA polymerase-1